MIAALSAAGGTELYLRNCRALFCRWSGVGQHGDSIGRSGSFRSFVGSKLVNDRHEQSSHTVEHQMWLLDELLLGEDIHWALWQSVQRLGIPWRWSRVVNTRRPCLTVYRQDGRLIDMVLQKNPCYHNTCQRICFHTGQFGLSKNLWTISTSYFIRSVAAVSFYRSEMWHASMAQSSNCPASPARLQ